MKQTASSTVNLNNKFCPHCSQECNNLSDDIKSLLLPISENGNDPEKINSSKYYDIDEMHNTEMPHKNNHFPYSLYMHVLSIKFLTTIIAFDIIAVSETQITRNKNHKTSIFIK